jgi:recombination protein RecR
MIEQTPSLMALLKQLQRVPYLASKNLYRVAQHFLELDEHEAELFCKVLLNAKSNLSKCQSCWTWKETIKECYLCTAPRRDQSVICVVETWQDLIAIEKAGGYLGVYHVLGGSICPLEGRGPEDLTIKSLVNRVTTGCKEVIFAFNQTPEGEATAAYIASKLKNTPIIISCLARGLPVGSSLESMDRLTVFKALSERRPF